MVNRAQSPEHLSKGESEWVDPDPFLLAAISLQAAGVLLQLVQLARDNQTLESSAGASASRTENLRRLEEALEALDAAILKTERVVRRDSSSPDKELYEASFRISLGVMSFSLRSVQEYHNALADSALALAGLTRWVGHVISNDPEIALALGQDVAEQVGNAAERLNKSMADGAPIRVVLEESKFVRDACRQALGRRLEKTNT